MKNQVEDWDESGKAYKNYSIPKSWKTLTH